jgi:putative acetyltransferase
MIEIRAERPDDYDAVRRVNDSAFGRPQEGALVDALRAAARPYVSLVAAEDERVVGHIFFSPVTFEPDGAAAGAPPPAAMGLAPMAVAPGLQRSGVGSRLVRAGLEECRRAGFAAVFVLGHADYYPRFGFSPAAPRGFRCEYDVPAEVFMVTELTPGALAGRAGLVKYHPEFASV